ncbi:MAG: GNAT family N-acetyltransferase, partial [Alphaproteobacteria bacterium]
ADKGGRPAAVLVMRARARPQGRLGARMLRSCTEMMYSSIYEPILDPQDGIGGLREIVAAIAAEKPAFDVVRLDNLDHDNPLFETLRTDLREAGFTVQPFFNFGSWYEDITGPTLDDYLARRSSQTRYLIGRHVRKLARSGRGRFALVTGGADLESAIADYERVYAHSWKMPDPFPRCMPAIARAAARAGALRLGLLYVDGEPAAAQIWIVGGGCATILRLGYDEKFRKLAVATVLTHELMRHVIEVDKAHEVDIARGDEPYKKKLLGQRRERWGIMAFNRRTAKGLLAAARHLGAHAAAAIMRKIRRRAKPAEVPGGDTPPE